MVGHKKQDLCQEIIVFFEHNEWEFVKYWSFQIRIIHFESQILALSEKLSFMNYNNFHCVQLGEYPSYIYSWSIGHILEYEFFC